MREAVIVEAVRSPIARGKMIKGDLSGMHTAHLFSRIQRAVVERAGIEPKDVEQTRPAAGEGSADRGSRRRWANRHVHQEAGGRKEVLEVAADLGDQLRVVRARLVEPEDGRSAGRATLRD